MSSIPTPALPTMVDRDLVLYDPGVICEYIDERYPHPPLMPVDPLSRARLRLAVVRIEQEWLPLIETIKAGGRTAEPARRHLNEALLAAVPLFKCGDLLSRQRGQPGRLHGGADHLAPARAEIELPRKAKPSATTANGSFAARAFRAA